MGPLPAGAAAAVIHPHGDRARLGHGLRGQQATEGAEKIVEASLEGHR